MYAELRNERVCGPGVAGECEELCGMHINEDSVFIPEVIDLKTGRSTSAGRKRRVGCNLSWEGSASFDPLSDGRFDETLL